MQKARGHTFPAPTLTSPQGLTVIHASCLIHGLFTLSKLNKVGAGHSATTACRCMVSGTFNCPNRGTFHRLVALLSTIGRRVVLSLGGWTPRLHTEFHELRATLER
jgi:hypothetical protein